MTRRRTSSEGPARSFRLILEYDGADFEGWQVQPEGRRTVQGTLEVAIARVAGERVRVVGSGRTDAGVHAEGQVASLRLETALEPERLRRALNGVLPDDLVVRALDEVEDDFDARRDATGKLYRYAVWNGPERSPLRRRRALCLQRPLDLAAMRSAAADLRGVHDFRSFQAAGSSVRSSVRDLRRLDVEGEAGAAVDFLCEGSGFLRHMVRNLVGTLLEIGSGRRPADGMPALLAARDRRQAGPTAPAFALTLVEVSYGGRPPFRVRSECATFAALEPREGRTMAARKKAARKKQGGPASRQRAVPTQAAKQKAAKAAAKRSASAKAAPKKNARGKGAASGAAKRASRAPGSDAARPASLRDIARSFASRHLI